MTQYTLEMSSFIIVTQIIFFNHQLFIISKCHVPDLTSWAANVLPVCMISCNICLCYI